MIALAVQHAAPIDVVTVTEDRAHVQRRASLDLGAGITRLRIDDVAPVIADKTLRVRASSNDVAVGEAKVVRRQVAAEPAEAHAALVRELEERVRASEVGVASLKRMQAAITLLHEAQRRVLEELAEDAARGMSEASGERAARAFEERERAAYVEALEAQHAQRELDKTIARLRSRLAQAGHKTMRVVASIEMTLSCSAAAKTDLVVEYLVPGACWRPEHTATLGKDGNLNVATDACVWQNTGEDCEHLGTDNVWDRSRRTNGAIEPHRMSDSGCRRRRVARHHHGAHSQSVQFGDERCGVCPGRVAEGDEPCQLYRGGRFDRNRQHSETFSLEFI